MKRATYLTGAVATLAIATACLVTASGLADESPAPIYLTKMPAGFRDWRLITVTHEEGNLHSLAAVLGNNVAIRAYREGKLPFPDGTFLVALHYTHSSSDENNKVFGQTQSFVPGSPTNIQFEVKDAKKYAATGGWGFGFFIDGKPVAEAQMKSCAPCHAKSPTDFVFARYAP